MSDPCTEFSALLGDSIIVDDAFDEGVVTITFKVDGSIPAVCMNRKQVTQLRDHLNKLLDVNTIQR